MIPWAEWASVAHSGQFGFRPPSLPSPAKRSNPFLQPLALKPSGKTRRAVLTPLELSKKLPTFAFLANASSVGTAPAVKRVSQRRPVDPTAQADLNEGLKAQGRETVYPPFVDKRTKPSPEASKILRFYGENGPFPDAGRAQPSAYPPFVGEQKAATKPSRASKRSKAARAQAQDPVVEARPLVALPQPPAAQKIRASAFPPFVGAESRKSEVGPTEGTRALKTELKKRRAPKGAAAEVVPASPGARELKAGKTAAPVKAVTTKVVEESVPPRKPAGDAKPAPVVEASTEKLLAPRPEPLSPKVSPELRKPAEASGKDAAVAKAEAGSGDSEWPAGLRKGRVFSKEPAPQAGAVGPAFVEGKKDKPVVQSDTKVVTPVVKADSQAKPAPAVVGPTFVEAKRDI